MNTKVAVSGMADLERSGAANKKPEGNILLKRKALTGLIGALLKHAVLLVASVVMILPFIWMITSSFKPGDEIFTSSFLALPSRWVWGNYKAAWHAAPFGRFFLNSSIIAVGVVVGQLITCSFAAYALTWVNLWGRRFLFLFIVATTMIPFESTIIPSYLVIKQLGWMNSYIGLIAPSLTSVFGIFLLRQFFLTVPKDLFEAAKMDGCTHFGILFRIMLPLSKTVLATMSLFAFLHAWNSYLWPLMITSSASMRTVQIGLRYMINVELGTQWPLLMAASTFIILPVLTFFLLMQKYFIRGVMQSGIKA
ncbi:carbohydrate ABC transporter permease [Paenibacillus aestuarii]|uniref:Carbohydrate ABC transporter permease n=1 Tax=Paenibacillus aestuarii TaxID=516965 RepID=A0ABW0K7W6_9BACL|nr:carbohydrate ABC transporter permease [Paenibacillus aestuarii]